MEPIPAPRHTSDEDTVDVTEIMGRLRRGLPFALGLALVGLVVAALITLLVSVAKPVVTSTRVVFSFPGFELGEYPDKSKFQPDDLRAPAVISEALRRQGLDTSSAFQSKVRGSVGIEGIIPANIVKERDRQRAAGQTPPPYIPDEYNITLSLARKLQLSNEQREHLLQEIVSVYSENFNRTYGHTPLAFGTAFETLRTADFPEYEIIFNSEIDTIKTYLANQTGQDASRTELDQRARGSASFRSPTTNFSFKDLLEQTNLFAQIQLNETLGLIHENGLSRNRATAMIKMNYYLRLLEDREEQAVEDEKVIRDLLTQSQARSQNVVLGVKSQADQTRGESTVIDQGLIDSLLANDAHNFLIRRALDAGLHVKRIQAEKNQLLHLRDNMKSFLESDSTDQSEVAKQVEMSLKNLEANYTKLIDNIRRTHADYVRQEFGDAIRLSAQITTESMIGRLAFAMLVGSFLGFALGAGLSLMNLNLRQRAV